MKQCFKCLESKELTCFYSHKRAYDGLLNKCKSCTLKDVKDYRSKNLDAVYKKKRQLFNEKPEYRRKQLDARYRKMCGVGIEWFDAKFKEQGGLCAICKKPGVLVLDHDHTTKAPRGLLHRNCNAGVGMLLDNFDVILNAAKYIQKHKGTI